MTRTVKAKGVRKRRDGFPRGGRPGGLLWLWMTDAEHHLEDKWLQDKATAPKRRAARADLKSRPGGEEVLQGEREKQLVPPEPSEFGSDVDGYD